MLQLSKACSLQQVPTRRSPLDSSGLAPCAVGHRHHWPPANSTRQLQLCSSRTGVLLKVDRSQGASRYNSRNLAKKFLAEHSGQWKAVGLYHVQGVLSSIGHQVVLCLSIPSAVEWGHRKSKWYHLLRNQEEHHGAAEGQVG